MEVRADDRRTGRGTFHYPERRTGFDRRYADDPIRALVDRPMVLVVMLVALNLLSAVDWTMTVRALAFGAQEANGVMRALIDFNPMVAGIIKAIIMLAVTLLIWRERRYRLVLITAVGALGVYGALMIYHAIGVATLLSH